MAGRRLAGQLPRHELLALAGLDRVLDGVAAAGLLDRRFRGLAKAREHYTRRSGTGAPSTGSPTPSRPPTACRRACALVEQSIAPLAGAWALRRWRGLPSRIWDVFRAAGALVCLDRWLHRVPT